MSEEVAISISNVSKSFRLPHEKADSVKSLFVNPFNRDRRKFETQHALKNINFEIKKGEFFGIVGRNGSGKSTLLKIIAGIYQPSAGEIQVNGKIVPFIELGVGFNPNLTGRENVYLNGALLGFSEKEVDVKYSSIVEFAELRDFMDQKLKNYSSGMQVRLAFSVATVLAESDILLIDEVLAVGDVDFQRKCFDYFKQLKKGKKTVVFVSHDMSAIREYCDRVVLIDSNEVVYDGNAEDTAREYSKLFAKNIDEGVNGGELMKKGAKWGTGDVDISDVVFSSKTYGDQDGFIEMSYVINDKKSFRDAMNPGFVIKNEQGQPVCGTNARILFGKCDDIVFGGHGAIRASVRIPNIFGGGKYMVDVAILSASNGEVLQWYVEAGGFRVVNDKTTPYTVSPSIICDFDREE